MVDALRVFRGHPKAPVAFIEVSRSRDILIIRCEGAIVGAARPLIAVWTPTCPELVA